MRIIQTPDYVANQIELCQLAFERAMSRFDIHDANIACAQKDFWIRRLGEFAKCEKCGSTNLKDTGSFMVEIHKCQDCGELHSEDSGGVGWE